MCGPEPLPLVDHSTVWHDDCSCCAEERGSSLPEPSGIPAETCGNANCGFGCKVKAEPKPPPFAPWEYLDDTDPALD